MNIRIKKLHPDAQIPKLAHHDDAGFDMYATETITLQPGEKGRIPTGISMEIPFEYAVLFWDKSSISHDGGIKTLGGVIDSGYRGEFVVGVINLGKEAYTFEKGRKIAQFLIQKVEIPTFEEVDELSETIRGEGTLGSTGK